MKLNLFRKMGVGFVASLLGAIVFVLLFAICLGPEVFIVFLILKLVGVLNIGWFYVCLPIIIAVAGTVLYTICLCLCASD